MKTAAKNGVKLHVTLFETLEMANVSHFSGARPFSDNSHERSLYVQPKAIFGLLHKRQLGIQ